MKLYCGDIDDFPEIFTKFQWQSTMSAEVIITKKIVFRFGVNMPFSMQDKLESKLMFIFLMLNYRMELWSFTISCNQ